MKGTPRGRISASPYQAKEMSTGSTGHSNMLRDACAAITAANGHERAMGIKIDGCADGQPQEYVQRSGI